MFGSDAASYTMKVISNLQMLYPAMIHITCVAIHGLCCVAETIQIKFLRANNLINYVKKVFKKSPISVQMFWQLCPSISLFLNPIITRWTNWPTSADYFVRYFNKIKSVTDTLDCRDAAVI